MRLTAILALVVNLSAATAVPTAFYNNQRGGENIAETILKPANVTPSTFGRLGTWTLDKSVYGQPLYVPGVVTSGGTKNLLFVGTMNNTIYALDTASPGSSPVWSVNFGAPGVIPTEISLPTFGGVVPGAGSGAVIDVANGWLFVTTFTNVTGTTNNYTLRKIRITDGTVLASTVIAGSVVGTGQLNGVPDDTTGPNLNFHANWQSQRTPLTLVGSQVCFGFGAISEGNQVPWHGWAMCYDKTSMAQTAIWCSTPNGLGGGVWEASGGFASDGTYLYITTGNGTWDGITNFGQSAVKLAVSNLALTDWFTPSSYASTNAVDADVSSGRAMLIPGTSKLTFGSKDGRVWNILTSDMGQLQGTGTAPQVFAVTPGIIASGASGIYGGTFAGNIGFFPIAGAPLFAFSYSGGSYNTTAIAQTALSAASVFASGSSNAGSDAILWAIFQVPIPANLASSSWFIAYNPTTLVPIWSDLIGPGSKFVSPVVADGSVYITSDSVIYKFGLLSVPSAVLGGTLKLGGTAKIQ